MTEPGPALYENAATVSHRDRTLAYARAMEAVQRDYSSDIEARIFYALALDQTALPTDKTYALQLQAAEILEPLYKKIVAGIRTVDKNHVIFLGGAQWDNNFKVFGPPFDSKLAYTFHKYWFDVKQEAVQEYVDFRDKYNVPVWMGESGENTDEWSTQYRTLLERNDIGWCFWPYKKVDATSCIASIDRPTDWDAIVAFADHPRSTFEEVRKNRPPT